MKYRSWCAGCLIKEIPILFTDRKCGKSKMSKKIFFEALLTVWKIKRHDTAAQFFKFAVTGGLGTITNLLFFFVFVDISGLPEIPVSIGCFLIAGTQNYIVNHRWAFAGKMIEIPLSIKQWVLFLFASFLGLAVNIMTMKLIILHFSLSYKVIAQACGIAVGLGVNFPFSKNIAFKNKK
jgi:putative flippase GtrA